MHLIQKIKIFSITHNLIQQNDKIIIGLSGGPDSVFLLHMLLQLQQEYNLTLIAAYLNHEWRAQAHQEEQFCHALAQKHGIPFVSQKLSALSKQFVYKGSKEEYARNARRFFLESVVQQYNANHIALGHHAQDQQETFFIRLIRGSSLTGLTAIKPQHGIYIRPLLETNKKDILMWLHEHNISYAIDTSNESQDFLRNRIRATVLPALHECDKRFDSNFLKTMHRLQETELFLEKATLNAFATIATQKNGTLIINCIQLSTIDTILHPRIILHWLITEQVKFPITESFLDEILRFLLSSRGGTHTITPQWSIIKKQNEAYIISQ
jgi:tRNA(Ile)-lysidine synthase